MSSKLESSPPEDERKIRILKNLQARIWSHMVVITISTIRSNGETSLNTASGTLVRIGGRTMLATAWHVLEKFVDIRNAGDAPALQIGSSLIPEPHYAYLDRQNDLVFVDVPDGAIANSEATPFDLDGQWPARRVSYQDPILITGFPALLRNVGIELLQGDFSYLGSVESVS